MDDVTDGAHHLFHGVLAAENEQQRALAVPLGIGPDAVDDVVADEALGGLMPGIWVVRDDVVGEGLRQLVGEGEHAAAHKIEAGAGKESAEDVTGARFAHRIRGNQGVSELGVFHDSGSKPPAALLLSSWKTQNARAASRGARAGPGIDSRRRPGSVKKMLLDVGGAIRQTAPA